MVELAKFQTEKDGEVIEYTVESTFSKEDFEKNEAGIVKELGVESDIEEAQKELERSLEGNREAMARVEERLEKLTVEAGAADYITAGVCGILAGLVDVFWVGEFSFSASKLGTDALVDQVLLKNHMKLTDKLTGLERLAEKGGEVGMLAAILLQGQEKAWSVPAKAGGIQYDKDRKKLRGGSEREQLICAVVNWYGNLIEKAKEEREDEFSKENVEVKLPQFFMKVIQEISSLPILQSQSLPELLYNLVLCTNGVCENYNMDLRSKLAIGMELGRQSMPIFLDELLIRGMYFIRQLKKYGNGVNSIEQLPVEELLPVNHREIDRLLGVSLGMMEVIDVGEAALHMLHEGKAAFLIHINYPGIGTMSYNIMRDGVQYEERRALLAQRSLLYQQRLELLGVKMRYQEADMWISAKAAGESVEDAWDMIKKVAEQMRVSYEKAKKIYENISAMSKKIEEKNPGMLSEIFRNIHKK